jgi:hypothetical protein
MLTHNKCKENYIPEHNIYRGWIVCGLSPKTNTKNNC